MYLHLSFLAKHCPVVSRCQEFAPPPSSPLCSLHAFFFYAFLCVSPDTNASEGERERERKKIDKSTRACTYMTHSNFKPQVVGQELPDCRCPRQVSCDSQWTPHSPKMWIALIPPEHQQRASHCRYLSHKEFMQHKKRDQTL